MAYVFRQQASVLALESTGIAATLLPGGTTAYAGLMLPLESDSWQLPRFAYGTEGRADAKREVLKRTLLLIWDELLFANRCLPECANRGCKSSIPGTATTKRAAEQYLEASYLWDRATRVNVFLSFRVRQRRLWLRPTFCARI